MNGGRDPLNWSLSDGLAETISAESCHFVLETSPPDYVQKISRYLEESVVQTGQDQASRDSDSGDSLFLTQKFVTEPVRPRRGQRTTLWSDPASPRDLEDSENEEEEDEEPAFASHRENDLERRRKTCRLPKYSFPFLKERKWKPRSTQLCVPQNAGLHNCGMGGFFKCVRELSQRRRRGDDPGSSLPTVDVDGEEISPLSEREEEWSEDEDIRVVERKCLVVSSKAKRPGPWNTPKKRHEWVKEQRKEVCNTGQETAPGRKRKQAKASTSKVLWTPAIESTSEGDPSSRAQKDSGRSEELIKSPRNITAQTETPKTESRGSQDLPQSPPHLERDDANGDESRVEKEKEGGEQGGEGNLPDTATSENLDAADAESPALQISDELESNEKNLMEKTPLGQEETGEVAPMKHKKKKKRKNEPEVENSGQEDGSGDLECDMRTEDNRKVKKKRKRREKRKEDEHEEEAEEFSSNAAAETLNNEAEIRRKRKKEKSFINTEEATNSALDQLEEPESCLENPTASQETSDSSNRKSKKHKKKKSHHDAAQVGKEEGGGDVSTSNDAATRPRKKKKKKKTGFSLSDGTDLSDETQKTTGDRDAAEPVTKKKKKKRKKEKLGEITADTVEQSHDSVSARWVEEGTSSFLAADEEGKDESTATQPAAVSAGDPASERTETSGGVKKKKKRKRNHEGGFDEPSETHQSDPQETTNAGEKRKKKRRRDDGEPVTPVERLEITADEEQLQTDEAVVLKKKKKKKKNRTEENPATVTEDAESVLSTSHKNKLETSAMASSDVPGNLTLSHFKDKKKKMKKTDNGSPEGESLAPRVELEPKKQKKKERNDPTAASGFISNRSTLSETDSASYATDDMKKNKHKKAKRRLHNSNEDFLPSC